MLFCHLLLTSFPLTCMLPYSSGPRALVDAFPAQPIAGKPAQKAGPFVDLAKVRAPVLTYNDTPR
jgi:hypothetical protein